MSGAPSKVLVAVHGIGDQTRYETLQHLVNLCFGQAQRPEGVPIGFLHSGLFETGKASVAVSELPGLGFAEVFWADIGRGCEEYVLEESVAWSHTIVERLGVISDWAEAPAPFDYDKIKRVLTDIGIAIRLTRWLNRGLTAMGIGSFDLEKILVRFLGDVQLYAEFKRYRSDIMRRFYEVVRAIAAQAGGAEIHLCAHSQGSVVAFLGLLEGYRDGEPWVSQVKSLITIGSPIDKFLILWPELWLEFAGATYAGAASQPKIRWMNYADRGDPVGYELDTARQFTTQYVPGLFAAQAPIERIYRRYVIPGVAHIDYWKDQDVFNEWLVTSMIVPPDPGQPNGPPEPRDRRVAKLVAPSLPFFVSVAFAFVAAHFYATGINQIYAAKTPPQDGVVGLPGVAAIALLIVGTVALSGAARTSPRLRWLFLGLFLFLGGAAATLLELGGSPNEWPHGFVLRVVMALGGVALLQYFSNLLTAR